MTTRIALFAGLAAAACALLGSGPAQADDPPPAPSTCVLEGRAPARPDGEIHDRASGGKVVAKLTGALVPLRVSELPVDPQQGRVRLTTAGGAGGGHVRIEGYAPLSVLETFAARDLPVRGQALWITMGQRVRIVEARGASLTVEHAIMGSRGQVLRTTVGCDAVVLVPPHADEASPAANARGWEMRTNKLELFDGPNGAVVFALELEEDARKLFYANEGRSGFVRVQGRGDITIDAWARASDLNPLKPGELFDTSLPEPRGLAAKSLTLEGAPAAVAVPSEVPVYARPENGEPIGYVEAGARVFPMDRGGAWINVYPEGLGVMPPDGGGGFWIRASSLPQP
ncbi:MAG: hypothetical protein HY908_17990 [Myxococcales bacterium]|nr:hypothetical protein [Myxococcales bacterium]